MSRNVQQWRLVRAPSFLSLTEPHAEMLDTYLYKYIYIVCMYVYIDASLLTIQYTVCYVLLSIHIRSPSQAFSFARFLFLRSAIKRIQTDGTENLFNLA